MYKASQNGELNRKKFKKWCWENDVNIRRWFEEVLDFERKMLINDNKISVREIKIRKLGYRLKGLVFDVDSSMMIEAEKIAGFKNYLKKISSIQGKEFIDINFLNDYLMYAQMFGISSKVARKLNSLYSEIIKNMDIGYSCDDITFLNMLVNTGISAARKRALGRRNDGV